jgi:tRNA pseudouridine13 synthase
MTFDPLAPPPLMTRDLPGISGRIKVQPEDFEVEEVPAYEPSGQGDFLYLQVEKRSMGAEFFLRQVARRLEIPVGEIGTAGLKDRHAVTRQWVSVPAAAESRLAHLDGEGITVLRVSRHGNKLKPGHLRGNRFRILVRDVAANANELLPALLEAIRTRGLPNFYGEQRFGRDGETVGIGFGLLTGQGGRRVNPFLRKLALSAMQSALFNRCVARRMEEGLLRTVLAGDVVAKWPFGGMFVAEDLAAEQARFEAREIIPAGPMFGRKMFAAKGQAAEREQAVLEEVGLSMQAFAGFGKLLNGTRRYTLVYVDDLTGTIEAEGVRLSFTLPAGSYATMLVRELTHGSEMEGEEAE